MAYDLLIKNGWVVDGSGLPRYRADVGVKGGKIAAIGRLRESAREVIDAEGRVVAPGFMDGHTHMDAQVFWDPLGTSSCWHGITSVVMGNCGFTLAPCAKKDRHLVIRNLERAEDIAGEAMEAGIDWRWTTFPEYLDTLDSLPKGINYSGYIGHSALRTYVMGERAFDGPAGEDDLAAMERELRNALMAGAIGFTTSRSPSHETPDSKPVASRMAAWSEVQRLVGAMGELNAGIFELAGEGVDRKVDHPDLPDYHRRLKALAVETGRPITFGLFTRKDAPDMWRHYVKLIEETNAAGGRMFAQVHSRRPQRGALVQDPAAIRPAAGVEGAARAAARRAADAPARSGAAQEAGRGRPRAGHPQGARHRGPAGRLRLALRDGSGGSAAPVGGRDRARARGGPGRGDDRPRPREGHGSLLLQSDREREPGAGDRADQAPAGGGDLLRLGRPRLPAHGLVAPDLPAEPLGAHQAGAHPRAGGAHAVVRAAPATGASRIAA